MECRCGCVAVLLLLGCLAAPAEPAPLSIPAALPVTSTNEAARLAMLQLETLLRLQQQQEATLAALEQTRHEVAESLALGHSNNLAQFAVMTASLSQQRAQDLKVLRDSNRLLLAIIVGFSAWMLLSILFLNLASIRALNRLSTVFSSSALLPGSEAQAIADARAASRQLLLFPGEEGQRQLGNAVLQLQHRIQSLERSLTKSQGTETPPASRPSPPAPAPAPGSVPAASPAS